MRPVGSNYLFESINIRTRWVLSQLKFGFERYKKRLAKSSFIPMG